MPPMYLPSSTRLTALSFSSVIPTRLVPVKKVHARQTKPPPRKGQTMMRSTIVGADMAPRTTAGGRGELRSEGLESERHQPVAARQRCVFNHLKRSGNSVPVVCPDNNQWLVSASSGGDSASTAPDWPLPSSC